MRRNFVLTVLLIIPMLATLGMGSWLSASAAAPIPEDPSPSIVSDYVDYAPGATVNLTGANWQGDTQVRIVVNDDIGQTWTRDVTVAVAEDGTISDTFQLPSYFVARYVVAASGQQTGRVATTSFTDASIGTYDQCSNDDGDGYATGDTGCRWINGNLQSNNSTYFEGDATVQRVWLTEFVPGSTHTLTLKYGTTKGSKHAYDFLTTWDWSESWITLADRCQDITNCTTANETTLDIPEDPKVPNSFEPSAPGDRQFVMRGGTLNSATTPAIVSGDYFGDSETVITIDFTVNNSGEMCATKQGTTTCAVALWFGAHVAAQANWGLGQGAGSISGSPYHVALDAMDGASVGQRDNQMQANVVTLIPNGTIIIVKDAVPDDAQDFSFNLTNNSTINQNFSLDDDADPTLPNSQTFSVPPGTWTASELNIPGDWSLTNLVCSDPTNNTTVNVGTGVATINLASSETVTCTFTDTKAATPTPTSTSTPTNTPTNTPTDTPTNTPTDTPTNTPTDTPTNTPTDTPTNTPTDTPTNTPTDTPTNTPTDTPTNTPTDTPTSTPTNTPTDTPTNTPTNTLTNTPTDTPTNTPTNTPTDTPTNTPTNTPTDTPTSTPTNTPTDTPTNTPTNTSACVPNENLCSLIRSPGFWKNWDNHFTEAQFQALIAATQDYSGLTVAQAKAILDNNADQYHRHLLAAELNVAWNPELGNAIYTYGSLAGMTVNQILHLAFITDPANASDDLIDAVLYLGSEGENDTPGECRIIPPPPCPTRTPTNTPTNTPTDTPTNTPTDTPTNTPTDTPTNTPTNTSTDTPTNTPTNTPTDTPTNTPTKTPTLTKTPTKTSTLTKTPTKTKTPTRTPTKTPTSTPSDRGQLKVCKVLSPGVTQGQVFTFKVNDKTYKVLAGYCTLAGQYSLNTMVTVRETIPSGYFVSKIEVRPSNRTVSTDKTIGKVVVKIGTGVTEVLYTNSQNGAPTATPTRTPNGSPTATSSPKGRLQICKEASGDNVSGYFTFRFETRSRSIPVGSCSLIISVNAGNLVVKEDARSGYAVVDIYTIPANRLISKSLSNRTATVKIVEGTSNSQTIVVFVNRKVTSKAPSNTTAAYAPNTSSQTAMTWQGLWDMVLGQDRRLPSQPASGSFAN